MEFLLFAIVGIIVAVISAATKQKPKQKQDDEQQQQQAPRRTVSDIQRAFNMLLDDFDGDAQPGQQQTYNHRQPLQKPQEPTVYGEGDSSWDGAQTRPARVRKKPAVPVNAAANKYTNVKLDRYFMDEPEEEQPLQVIKKTAGGLDLHFGKNELVHAVIYSEILARKRR